jgi:hypothetical protein
MHYTIEALLNGQQVTERYRAARDHWRSVLRNVDATDPDAIAEAAEAEQMWFEHNCGGRYIGQEIMAVAGIAQYYTTATGFDENLPKAKAMYEGLLQSKCSVEIHGHARDMAKLFEELTEEV